MRERDFAVGGGPVPQQTDKKSDSALEGAKWITENANSIDFIHASLSLAININWFLDNFKFTQCI